MFKSKLPNIGTTIFTEMSALAAQTGAINLSQGFPNYDCDERLRGLAAHYISSGHNQYAPMAGVLALRERLVDKIERSYGQRYDAGAEITITAGATQAIYTAITAFVGAGDEVILIEPAYDCYGPAIELCGARAVSYQLEVANNWRINWAKLGLLVSEKTRMIIINTPQNPCASVWTAEDMAGLCGLVAGTNILVLSDEVYEHLVLDGRQHLSVLGIAELRERTMAVYSFGKTLHATGWKLGYIVGAAGLMAEFRKVHQFNVFCVNAPLQYAIADFLEDSEVYLGLPKFFEGKRDFFLSEVADIEGLRWPTCEGTYFQLADYSGIASEMGDRDFAVWLTREIGVAVIPLSVFYTGGGPSEQRLVRFCFAKTEDTLAAAAERLRVLGVRK